MKASGYSSSEFVKLMLIGNSGAGKTGALTSLVAAGYQLRIIDLDAGVEALINHVQEECPDKLDNIEVNSYRDMMKMTSSGTKVIGAPSAYVDAMRALEKWPDDGSSPDDWGTDTVLVIDSLTNLGLAAFRWARAANPAAKEPRTWYKTAQDLLEDMIANVTSESFRTNVLVISHIDMIERQDGSIKGFASSIGKALGPKLPRFFNTLILSEPSGFGKSVRRKLKTLPTAMLDLKNPAPMKVEAEYDISDGLAKLFEKLKKPLI